MGIIRCRTICTLKMLTVHTCTAANHRQKMKHAGIFKKVMFSNMRTNIRTSLSARIAYLVGIPTPTLQFCVYHRTLFLIKWLSSIIHFRQTDMLHRHLYRKKLRTDKHERTARAYKNDFFPLCAIRPSLWILFKNMKLEESEHLCAIPLWFTRTHT